MTEPAPLYSDTLALCEWLLGRLGDDPRVLSRQICERALDLLQSITLALANRRRDHHLALADEALIALRCNIRLAGESGYLSSEQVIHVLERGNTIGRQLGGWMRSRGDAPDHRPV